MTQALQNQIDRLYRRILMNVAPAKILATDDTGPIHRVQVNLNGGPEMIDQLAVMQHYGLNTHAPVGSDAAAMFIAGQRSNAVIIATNNQKARVRNLKPGEVSVYTDEGDSLHFGRSQAVTLTAGNSFAANTKAATIKGTDSVTLDAPTTTVTQNLKAHGNVDASGGFFVNGVPIGSGGGGTPGPPGPAGPPGTAATIAVGTTVTGAPGTPAAVVNIGTPSAAVFDFTIPAGVAGATGATGATGSPGAAASIAVGTTTTGAPGTAASVTNTGSSAAAVFNFTIPAGVAGATGAAGTPGTPGAPGAAGAAATIAVGTTTTGAAGSAAAVVNVGSSSAAVFNFTIPQGIQGATGAAGPAGPPGSTPAIGGNNLQLQYNNAGALGGTANWTFVAPNLIGNASGGAPIAAAIPGLQVIGTPASAAGASIDTYGGAAQIQFRRADGTPGAPTALLNGEVLSALSTVGWNGSAFSANATNMRVVATQAWSNSANGAGVQLATTPSGATALVYTLGLGMGGLGGLTLPSTATDMGQGTVDVSVGYYINGANIFAGLPAGAMLIGNGANAAPVASTHWSLTGPGSTVFFGNMNTAAPTNIPLPGIQLIGANSQGAGLLVDCFIGSPTIVGRAAGGTQAAPAVTPANQNLVYLTGRGWNGTAYSGDVCYVLLRASETWSATANGTLIAFVTTAATTTVPRTAMQIGSGTTSAAGGVTIGSPTGGDLGFGSLNVQNAMFAGGNVSIGGTCQVAGLMTIGATIQTSQVSGAFTIAGAPSVTGLITAQAGLSCTAATFSGVVTASNSIAPASNNSAAVGTTALAFNQMNSYNWFTASDRREKINIEPLPPSLDLVEAIAPVRFRWAEGDDERTHWGFIAQEVGEAMAGQDFGGHLVDSESGRERLAYNELIAVLWQATRELAARVAHLEAAA